MKQDFNIEAEAKGVLAPHTESYNVSITNGRIEIRLYWAGKGTQAIPDRGTHGPLISAITLENPSTYFSFFLVLILLCVTRLVIDIIISSLISISLTDW